MTHNAIVGKRGEEIAEKFLQEKGYKILEKNFRKPWGELDLIVKNKKGILIFVEVKALTYLSQKSKNFLQPEDNFSHAKLIKTQRAAQMFVGKYPKLIKEDRGWQIDLIAIKIFPNTHEITHYENV